MKSENKKVSFMIIGAMKCGTTALSQFLDQHVDISIHDQKEPNIFNKKNWKVLLEEYYSHFDSKAKYWGEASTHYTKYPISQNAPTNIHSYNPEMKLIYIVRHPFERIVSDYMHQYMRGYTKLTLSEAIKELPDLIDKSKYYMQLEKFRALFTKDQILVLAYDDFKSDHMKLLGRITAFIGVDAIHKIKNTTKNTSLNNIKPLVKYDNIQKKVPSFIRFIIPKRIKNLLRKITHGKEFIDKPKLSVTDKDNIYTSLLSDSKKLHVEYGVENYLENYRLS